MKLLVVCQYYYPEQFRVSDVCSKLSALGHEVTVLTGLPNYPMGETFPGYSWDELRGKKDTNHKCFAAKINAYIEQINGVNVIRCKLTPRKKGIINLVRNYLSFTYQATNVAKSMLNSDIYKFDKIVVFQYSPVTMAIPGIIFKRYLKKPLFIYCFDLWPESIVSAGFPNHGIFYKAVLELSKMIYRKADTIIISSKQFKKYFTEKLNIHQPIIYLPIYAEDLFHNAIKYNNIESKANVKVMNLVFAGNIGEMQSVDTIIKAASLVKSFKEIHFHIVGNGSALDKCKQLANDLSLNNITFHGYHPIEEMPKYYELADAFLVTLKKDPFISYTLPGKVQSYMAYGKPILAAIDGETSEVIKEAGCGLCCESENYTELANIILNFANEVEKRHKYGDCSKAYYDRSFSYSSFMDSFLSILSAK